MARDQRELITKEMIRKRMLNDLRGVSYMMIGLMVSSVLLGVFISGLFGLVEPNAWWVHIITWLLIAFLIGFYVCHYLNRRRIALKGEFTVVRDTVADIQVEVVRKYSGKRVRYTEEHVFYFTNHGRCVVSEDESERTSVGDGFFFVLSQGRKREILMKFSERAYRMEASESFQQP